MIAIRFFCCNLHDRFHMFYTWCEHEINNAKKEKNKTKQQNPKNILDLF